MRMPSFSRKWIQKASAVIAAALGVLVAGGASGGTLSIIPDATTYTVGDTITLDIVALGTDMVFEFSNPFVELTLSAPESVSALSVSQGPLSYSCFETHNEFPEYLGDFDWSLGSLDLATSEVIDQSFPGDSAAAGAICEFLHVPNPPLATATFTATSPGQVTFGFNASTFNFFDAAPTSTATIEILPIPEPGTATLLALGITGIAARQRNHRRRTTRRV